jgi:hypothetical protein
VSAQLVSNLIAKANRRPRLKAGGVTGRNAAEEVIQADTVRDPGFTERFNGMLEFVPH